MRVLAIVAAAAAAAACATTYPATGLVVRVNPSESTVTVSHDEVPGLMNAMVMPFTVRGTRAMTGVRPGDRVAFRVVVRNDRSHIDRLQILSAAPADQGLISTPAASTLVPIGAAVPDFTLVDQRGAPVTLTSLQGRVVVVTFIYTRCPLPDYCPRMITNLAAVRDRFRARLGKDLTLLTVSFDPQYDTPERMADYARSHQAEIAGWHFLTGDASAIQQVCEAFGVEYWPDSGLITHTLQTAVIDRQGRLAAAVEGKAFTGRQIADLVQVVLER
jgi:protein SCO1/2